MEKIWIPKEAKWAHHSIHIYVYLFNSYQTGDRWVNFEPKSFAIS